MYARGTYVYIHTVYTDTDQKKIEKPEIEDGTKLFNDWAYHEHFEFIVNIEHQQGENNVVFYTRVSYYI